MCPEHLLGESRMIRAGDLGFMGPGWSQIGSYGLRCQAETGFLHYSISAN